MAEVYELAVLRAALKAVDAAVAKRKNPFEAAEDAITLEYVREAGIPEDRLIAAGYPDRAASVPPNKFGTHFRAVHDTVLKGIAKRKALREAVAATADKAIPKDSPLTTMPSHIQLELFKRLDKMTSAFLGLTCKKLWKIHYETHGKVTLADMAGGCLPQKLFEIVVRYGKKNVFFPKPRLISQWMGPRYFYNFVSQKFWPIEEERAFYHQFQCPRELWEGEDCEKCKRFTEERRLFEMRKQQYLEIGEIGPELLDPHPVW